jgi:hypothetical protein
VRVGKKPSRRATSTSSSTSEYVSITRERLEKLEAAEALVADLERANGELSGALMLARAEVSRWQAACRTERTRAEEAEALAGQLRLKVATTLRQVDGKIAKLTVDAGPYLRRPVAKESEG